MWRERFCVRHPPCLPHPFPVDVLEEKESLPSLFHAEFGILDDEGIKDVFVDEGDPLTLGCSNTTGYPRPFVYWLIQMTNGALRMINSSRMTVDPHGSLHFSMVRERFATRCGTLTLAQFDSSARY